MSETSDINRPSALAVFGVLAGPRLGEELPVHAPVISIGQDPQNDLVLEDDSVSRNHAKLEFKMGSWLLTDLNSTNGTAIEGVKITAGVPTPLAYASTVRFGGVKLQFREVEDADPEAARATFREAEPEDTVIGGGFRLPLWIFLLILIVLALVAYLVIGGMPGAESPVTEPLTWLDTADLPDVLDGRSLLQ